MGKILKVPNLNQIKQESAKGLKLVLVGGCFDILHAGHRQFLKKSKKLGDILIVLLESDKRITKLKGKKRPINKQAERATAISKFADFVICLPNFKKDRDYEKLVKRIEPDIIAFTRGTRVFDWEKTYAEERGCKLIEVMRKKQNYSTSRLTKE